MQVEDVGDCVRITIPYKGEPKEAWIDAIDKERVLAFPNNWRIQRDRNTFYVRANLYEEGKTKQVQLHRFLLGVTDPLIYVDHEDHNGLNNRRSNLSKMDNQMNQCNRSGAPSNSTTGIRGVSFKKEVCKYEARVKLYGKKKHLGLFVEIRDAERAVNAFWEEYWAGQKAA